MSDNNRTCRYCGHRFETAKQREDHVPCPERDKGDDRK